MGKMYRQCMSEVKSDCHWSRSSSMAPTPLHNLALRLPAIQARGAHRNRTGVNGFAGPRETCRQVPLGTGRCSEFLSGASELRRFVTRFATRFGSAGHNEHSADELEKDTEADQDAFLLSFKQASAKLSLNRGLQLVMALGRFDLGVSNLVAKLLPQPTEPLFLRVQITRDQV